jgi:hypothetical protein
MRQMLPARPRIWTGPGLEIHSRFSGAGEELLHEVGGRGCLCGPQSCRGPLAASSPGGA